MMVYGHFLKHALWWVPRVVVFFLRVCSLCGCVVCCFFEGRTRCMFQIQRLYNILLYLLFDHWLQKPSYSEDEFIQFIHNISPRCPLCAHIRDMIFRFLSTITTVHAGWENWKNRVLELPVGFDTLTPQLLRKQNQLMKTGGNEYDCEMNKYDHRTGNPARFFRSIYILRVSFKSEICAQWRNWWGLKRANIYRGRWPMNSVLKVCIIMSDQWCLLCADRPLYTMSPKRWIYFQTTTSDTRGGAIRWSPPPRRGWWQGGQCSFGHWRGKLGLFLTDCVMEFLKILSNEWKPTNPRNLALMSPEAEAGRGSLKHEKFLRLLKKRFPTRNFVSLSYPPPLSEQKKKKKKRKNKQNHRWPLWCVWVAPTQNVGMCCDFYQHQLCSFLKLNCGMPRHGVWRWVSSAKSQNNIRTGIFLASGGKARRAVNMASLTIFPMGYNLRSGGCIQCLFSSP